MSKAEQERAVVRTSCLLNDFSSLFVPGMSLAVGGTFGPCPTIILANAQIKYTIIKIFKEMWDGILIYVSLLIQYKYFSTHTLNKMAYCQV